MGEQIEVLIVGAHDAKLLARLRESVEAQGHIVVNVGTVGHVGHGRDLPNLNDLGELLTPYVEPGQRIGKGQRKANKANRWR